MQRCEWVKLSNPVYVKYHDEEWGVPVYDDRKLFEMLILEWAHAGLSWETILMKRETYKKAFDNFDVKKVAQYDEKKQSELLLDPGIVRNKLKIKSSIQNARVFIEIQKEFGIFSNYIWGMVENKVIVNSFETLWEYQTSTSISDKISKDLKKRGMNFVWTTIIYAFMQAVWMVDDHQKWCFKCKK